MLKIITAGLLASVLALPALAQTSLAPAPGAPNNTGGAAPGAGSPAGNVNFIQTRDPEHFRTSDLIGRDVYGANNEDIGEINDVLVDRSGRVTAVVLGVGGFLGIGEKDVAVPMQALQFQMNTAANTAGAGNTGAGNTANTPATTGSTGAGGATATGRNTGTTGAANTSNNANTAAAGNNDDAQRIMVSLTRQQLEQAPAFQDNNRNNTGGNTGGATTGNTNAPRQ
ncbi:PRC-barrel domain-containing protein [Microvirga makkahensis]|uniref:PRC-barrel domain-containing protein n=1 Tax=Microvirga makkahensis TaxID=1128670 RepID=UPI00197B5078|nr:PRC-barrel domain-containing protein [Microvirga makkahensis]